MASQVSAPVAGVRERLVTRLQRLDAPTTTYYLLLVVTSVLVVLGLVMVLSASMVKSLQETDSSSAFSIARSQAIFAVIGTIGLVIASRIPIPVMRRLAIPSLLAAWVLQLLVFVPGVGMMVNGNRNWIRFGPFSMQPSELIKLGLILSGAAILGSRRAQLATPMRFIVPYLVPYSIVSLGLILLGHDLGTALIAAAVVGAVLFAAGVPSRYFAGGLAFALTAIAVLVLTSPNRLGRFDVWLGRDTNIHGAARQPIHGRFALADGGWFGLGLGASREKWSWLSEPHNDFIFAIIGEELGLPGTLAVLALFALLAYACFRLVTGTSDNFVRIASAGIMAWIVVQAMINIGSVIGAVPVIGVPLPLVSSGGSSLITTMLGLGVLLAFARNEPGCREALAARSSTVRRSRAILPIARSRRSGR